MGLTVAQQMRVVGFKGSLGVRGRTVVPFGAGVSGDAILVLVQELPPVMDMIHSAQGENPVYVSIMAIADGVSNPRPITNFTEVGDDGLPSGKNHQVIAYEENAADVICWRWKCESQRS